MLDVVESLATIKHPEGPILKFHLQGMGWQRELTYLWVQPGSEMAHIKNKSVGDSEFPSISYNAWS